MQLAAALNGLRGGGGGLKRHGKLRAAAGFDRLNVYGADKTSGRGPSVGAGKYIVSNIRGDIEPAQGARRRCARSSALVMDDAVRGWRLAPEARTAAP